MLQAASRCTYPKFIPGNMAHFFKNRMTDPVTALISDMDENDDNYLNFMCELVTRHPGYTTDTYNITSALLALSVRLGMKDRPHDLVDTLCVRPSHLPVTASVTGSVRKTLVVGNYSLSPADMDTLKQNQWLNDNVSSFEKVYHYCHIWIRFFLFFFISYID